MSSWSSCKFITKHSVKNNFPQATQSVGNMSLHVIFEGTIKAYSSMNQLSYRPYLTKAPSSLRTIKLLLKTIFSSCILYSWKNLGWWYGGCESCLEAKHFFQNNRFMSGILYSFDFIHKAALYKLLSITALTKGPFMNHLRHHEVIINLNNIQGTYMICS